MPRFGMWKTYGSTSAADVRSWPIADARPDEPALAVPMSASTRRGHSRHTSSTPPPVAVRTLRMPSPQYLIAHACFACRKSFKVAPRPAFTATCPNCSAQLHEMGRSFRAPPTKDTEQWATVQALFDAGFRFSSYRSVDGPPLPDRLSEVDGFIRDYPEHPLRVAPPQSRSGRGIS